MKFNVVFKAAVKKTIVEGWPLEVWVAYCENVELFFGSPDVFSEVDPYYY